MANLPTGKTAYNGSGSASATATFTIPNTGTVQVKLWGSGGGGAVYSGTGSQAANSARGGGGGFTVLTLNVVAGDSLQIDVGGGGGGVSNTTHLAGAAGWPDGGEGGWDTGGYYTNGGGGGGSSRVWLNGVLCGVAGAGGGGGATSSSGGATDGNPGYGGGSSGSSVLSQAPVGTITGGTQSAGGTNPFDSTQNGSSLHGGNGHTAGFTTARAANVLPGGGGGGGYYGGAGGGHDLSFGKTTPGSGGSGYVKAAGAGSPVVAASGSTTAATSPTSAGAGDSDYLSGAGNGAAGLGSSTGAAGSGGNGRIVLNYTVATTVTGTGSIGTVTMSAPTASVQIKTSGSIGTVNMSTLDGSGYVPLPEAVTTQASYIGSKRVYKALTGGQIHVKMWGGGGGGAFSGTNTAATGGAGGYTDAYFIVAPSDIVEVWTGGHGGIPATGTGGPAGWPDGGSGGYSSAGGGDPNTSGSGGGGSSRLYINGELMAVAGAGGGAHRETGAGGAGGGSAGTDGVGTATYFGGAGTQSAGGSSPVVGSQGSALQGGNGNDGSATAGISSPGGGGGGGYYGGGGGRGNFLTGGSETIGPGGGGSGYLNSGHVRFVTGTTTTGAGTAPPSTTDSAYVAGVGVGGAAGAVGGDGLVSFFFVSGAAGFFPQITLTPVAGAPSGGVTLSQSLDTITMSALTAGVVTGVPIGPLRVVTMSAMGGEAGIAAGGIGQIGTVTLNGQDIGGQGVVEQNVITSIVDYSIVLSQPLADGAGAALADQPFPGPIVMTVPVASIQGDAAGSLAEIMLSAVDILDVSAGAPGSLPVIAVTAPTSLWTLVSQPIASVTVTPPSATIAGVGNITADLPNAVTMFPAEAVAGLQGDAAGAVSTVNVSPTQADGSGQAQTSGDIPDIGPITPPQALVNSSAGSIPTVQMNPALAAGQGFAAITAEALSDVVLTAPEAPSVNGSGIGDVGTINLSAVTGGAVSVAFANGALMTITLHNPVGLGGKATLTTGDIPDITVTQPAGSASVSTNTPVSIGTITLTTPAASAMGAVNVVATYDLSVIVAPPGVVTAKAARVLVTTLLKITMSPPQAVGAEAFDGYTNSAIPTIYLTPPTGLAYEDVGTPGFAGGDMAVIYLFSPDAVATGEGLGTGSLDPIIMDVGDVYADSPTETHIRFLRSAIGGHTPGSLRVREIALNEKDGVLFSRAADGSVRKTPFGAVRQASLLPTGGTAGQVVDGTLTWVDPAPVYTLPVRSTPTTESRVLLGDTGLGSESVTPPMSTVHYRPFFVPRRMKLSQLGVNITQAGAATAHLGVCTWNPAGTPGTTIASVQVSCVSVGMSTAAVDLDLKPGWYASMFAAVGVSISIGAFIAPRLFQSDLTAHGDPTATFGGSLAPPPSPTGYRPTAHTFVTGVLA